MSRHMTGNVAPRSRLQSVAELTDSFRAFVKAA